MKIRLLPALIGLAICFILPTFAQQKDSIDGKVAQQIRALAAKYDDALSEPRLSHALGAPDAGHTGMRLDSSSKADVLKFKLPCRA
jgi:hypothetical protein